MTGLTVKRTADRAVFTITGQHEGGFVLSPVEHGSPVYETLAGLHEGYVVAQKGDKLPTEAPAQGDPHAGWLVLAQASHEAAQRVEQVAPPQETVEEVFARVAQGGDGS